jgi:hypothetical protein
VNLEQHLHSAAIFVAGALLGMATAMYIKSIGTASGCTSGTELVLDTTAVCRAVCYGYQVSNSGAIFKGKLTHLRGVNFVRSKQASYRLFNAFDLLSGPAVREFFSSYRRVV